VRPVQNHGLRNEFRDSGPTDYIAIMVHVVRLRSSKPKSAHSYDFHHRVLAALDA